MVGGTERPVGAGAGGCGFEMREDGGEGGEVVACGDGGVRGVSRGVYRG